MVICLERRANDTRCYFNVRSKADISQLNLPHGKLAYGPADATATHCFVLQ